MTTDELIALVAGWIDGVHVESAPARVAEEQAAYHAGPPLIDDRFRVTCPAPVSEFERRRIAAHEGAHAACATHLGIVVARAAIGRAGGGCCECESSAGDQLAMVSVDLAGVCVELLADVPETRHSQLRSSYDVLQARLRIDLLRARWDYDTQFFVSSTLALVVERLPAIIELQRALLARGSLMGDEVRALCE